MKRYVGFALLLVAAILFFGWLRNKVGEVYYQNALEAYFRSFPQAKVEAMLKEYDKGLDHYSQGQFREAAEHLLNAVLEVPTKEACAFLSDAYFQLRKFNEAELAAQKGLSLQVPAKGKVRREIDEALQERLANIDRAKHVLSRASI